MSVNNMATGRDYTFGVYDGNTGTVITFGDVQNVKVSQGKHDIVSRPYNAPPRFGYIPDGYALSFEITRTGPDLENLALLQNQNFNAGKAINAGFVNETITNPDGSVSRYQYKGFVWFLSDLGAITREATVKHVVTGMASTKEQIA